MTFRLKRMVSMWLITLLYTIENSMSLVNPKIEIIPSKYIYMVISITDM